MVHGKILMHYVYLLLLANRQIYAGKTDDLRRRIEEHQQGSVESTRHRRPVRLIFYEAFGRKDDATRREKYFKTSKGKSTVKLMLRETLNHFAGVAER